MADPLTPEDVDTLRRGIGPMPRHLRLSWALIRRLIATFVWPDLEPEAIEEGWIADPFPSLPWRSVLSRPAPVTPDLLAVLDENTRELHRWHTKHRLGRIDFEDCASPYCVEARAALSDRDAEPVSRDTLRLPTWQTIAAIYHEVGQIDGCEPGCEENHKDDAKVTLNVIRDAIAREAGNASDPLRLDPEDPESVERLARALLPGHDFMHEGDRDTCSERDMPAAMEAAERIARAFAAPDPTEETR